MSSAAAIAARLCSILLLVFVVAGLSLRSSRFVGIATRDAASALLAVSVIESISFVPGCFGLDILSYFPVCVAQSVANHTVALLIVGIITVSTGLGIRHATSGRIIKRHEVEQQYFQYRLYLLACSSLLATVGALLSGQEQHATLCQPAVDSWFLTYSLPALIVGICSICLHCYSIRKAADLPKLRVWTRDVAGQQGSPREVGDAATTKYVANDSKDSNPNDVGMQADMALVAGVMPRFLAGTAYTASVGTLESAVLLDAGGSLRLPAADTDQTVDGSLMSSLQQSVGNRGDAERSNRWKKAAATGQASTDRHVLDAQAPRPKQALAGITARGNASPDPVLEQGSQLTEAPHAVSNVSHVTFGNGSVGSFDGKGNGSSTGRRACSFDATSSDIRASNSDNGAKAKEHIIGRRRRINQPSKQDESDATTDAAHRASAPISEAEIGTQVTRRSSFDFGRTRGTGQDGAGAAASGATKLGRRDSGHGSFHGFPTGLLHPGLSKPHPGTSVPERAGEKPHAQSWSSPIPNRVLSFSDGAGTSKVGEGHLAGIPEKRVNGSGSSGLTTTAESSLKAQLAANASTPSGPARSLGTTEGLKRAKQGPLFEVTGSSSSTYGRRLDLRDASALRGQARSASTPNVSRAGAAAEPAPHFVPVQQEPGSDQSRRKVRPGQVPDITSLRMTSGLSDDSVEDVSSSSKAGILAATRGSSKPCHRSGSKHKVKAKQHGDESNASTGGSTASKGRSRSSDARGSSSASSTRVSPSKRRRDSVAAVLGGRSGARRDSPSSLVKEPTATDFLHMGRNAPPSLEAVRKELANASTNRRRSTGSFEGSSTTSKVARPSFDDCQNEGGNDSTLPSSLHGSAKLPSGMFQDASVGPNESYSEGTSAGGPQGDPPSHEQHTLFSMLCDTCCSRCCPCFLPGLRGMMSRDRLQRQYCVAPRLIGMMWVIIPLTILEVLMDASQLADKGTVSFNGPPMGPDDVDVKETVAGGNSGVMLTLATIAIALLFGLHKGVICWPCHVFYKKSCCCGAIQCKQSVDEAELSCARCVAAPCGGRDGAAFLFCCAQNSCAKCCGSVTGFEECCITEREAQKAIERSRPGYWTNLRKKREQNRLQKQRQGRGSAAAATKGQGQRSKETSSAGAFAVRVKVRSAQAPAPAPPQDAARVAPAPAPASPQEP